MTATDLYSQDSAELDPTTLPHVKTQLNFFKDLPIHKYEKPFVCEFKVSAAPGARQTNMEFEAHDVEISDIRGFEQHFTLERHGFEIQKYQTAMSRQDFESRDKIRQVYLKECEQLVRRRYNPSDVVILNFVLRDNDPATVSKYPGALRSVSAVHIDQSQRALFMRVVKAVGREKAEALVGRRCLIVNIWKPLFGPVEESPLGFCDIKTVRAQDCVPCDIAKKGEYDGESLHVRYEPGQQFYYLSRQEPDELLWLKMVESNPEEPAVRYQGVPHTSFELPKDVQNPSPAPRESIEVRLLVIF
ncbi:hypothetical protein V8C35DRAFT_310059 [Trichoderma chlorosporum]